MRPSPYTTDPPHISEGWEPCPNYGKGPCRDRCPHAACKRCGSETNLAWDPCCVVDESSRAFKVESDMKEFPVPDRPAPDLVDAMTAVECSMCHGASVILASIKCGDPKCGAVGNYQRKTLDVTSLERILRRAVEVALADRMKPGDVDDVLAKVRKSLTR